MDLFLYFDSFDWYEVTQTTAFRLLLVISLLTLDVSIHVITQPDSLWKTTAPNFFKEVSLMPLFFVGIDISKYKHDCCILSAADQTVVSRFVFPNNADGFHELLCRLNSLSTPEDIRIGFESTAHYALNLELFLEKAQHSFMEVNPVLISKYKESTTLRRTKTDRVDCESIARWLI